MPRPPHSPDEPRRRHAWTLAIVVVLLLGLHVWPVASPLASSTTLLGGWLPWDLAYPLLWMTAAWATIVFLVRRVWVDAADDEAPAARPETRSP